MEDTQVMDLDHTFEVDDSDDERTSPIVGWIEIENKRHELQEGEVRIGRDPSTCKIVIDNEKTLSKEHAVLEMDKTSVALMDLGSRNKTKIGKMILKPHVRYALQGGEKIKFGAVHGIYIVNKAQDSDSDACSDSVLNTPSKKTFAESDLSNDSSVISPTPQVSTKNITSLSKGNATKSSDAHYSNVGSLIISPTPSSSNKNDFSTIGGTNSNRSLEFIPETPANDNTFMGSSKMSFATQSTPFTSYAKSGMKAFTSPAFLSPISDMNADISKDLLEGSPNLQKTNKDSPFTTKLNESSVNIEQEDYNSDESTDVEDFFANEDEVKVKENIDSNSSDDICALPTQPFVRENFDSKNDTVKSVNEDDTQEILAAFEENEESHGNDSTQDVLDAFEESTQQPYIEEITEVATQQFDKTDSGTLFRKPFAAALKAKPKASKAVTSNNENLDIFDAPTQIFNPGSPDKSDSSDNEDIFNMPTQKYSAMSNKDDKLNEDIFDAPTQIFEAPIRDIDASPQICKAPTQVLDAPTQIYEAPTQSFNAPTQSCEEPIQISEPATHVGETSINVFDAPTQVYEAPVQISETVPQVGKSPTQDFDAPTQIFDTATHIGDSKEEYDAPTQVCDSPTRVSESSEKLDETDDVYEAPTQIFDASKDLNDSHTTLNDSSKDNVNEVLNKLDGEGITSRENESEDNTLVDSTTPYNDNNLDSTQRFESDNENNVDINVSTIPISSVLDKENALESSSHANRNESDDDDTDSNASETLLQNKVPVEEELDKTQVFSYSLYASECAGKVLDNKDMEDVSKSDTDEDSCASDSLLPMNNEVVNEKCSKIEELVDYNSDESTDFEGDETIPFTKSILTKEDSEKSALVKEIAPSTTKSVTETTQGKENIACDLSSATNDTSATNIEVNDLSKLELTGDSTTLHAKEISDVKNDIDEKKVEDYDDDDDVKQSPSSRRETCDTEFDTSEFGYSCFEIDSSILLSDESRSPCKKSELKSSYKTPTKVLKKNENEKLVSPSEQKLNVADESFEVEEIEKCDPNRSSKSQALFDLDSEDDEDKEDNVAESEFHYTDTSLSTKKGTDLDDETVVSSTPVAKTKKNLNEEGKDSAKAALSPSTDKSSLISVDLLSKKKKGKDHKLTDSDIEVQNLDSKPQNVSEEIDTDSVKGTRISRSTRGIKSKEESEISNNLNISKNESKARQQRKVSPTIGKKESSKARQLRKVSPTIDKKESGKIRQQRKVSPTVDKKELVIKQSGKRTRTLQNLYTLSVNEELDSSRSKRLRAALKSNNSTTEEINEKKLKTPKKHPGRKLGSDSQLAEENTQYSDDSSKEKKLLKEKKTPPDRPVKSKDKDGKHQVVLTKLQVSKTEDHKAINIISDEKPICNKPFQKPTSPVGDTLPISLTPEVKSVRTTRPGRTRAAPSRYSPSKTDSAETSSGKRSHFVIDNEVDSGSKKSKINKSLEKRNKKEDKTATEIFNQSDSNSDEIIDHLITYKKNKEKILDSQINTNLIPEKDNTNNKKRNNTKCEKSQPVAKIRTEVKSGRASLSPSTQVQRVTRHSQNVDTLHEEVVTLDSKSVVIGKRKADNLDKNSKPVANKMSKCSKSEETVEENLAETTNLKDKKNTTTIDKESFSLNKRSSRSKMKQKVEENALSLIEERENLDINSSEVKGGETISLRSSKGNENAEEKSVTGKGATRETKLVNSKPTDLKSTRSKSSKSKSAEKDEELSSILINDTKCKDKATSKEEAETDSEISIVSRRNRRTGTAVLTNASETVSPAAAARNSKSNATAIKSRKSTTAITIDEEKDKILPVSSRTSTRHSQRQAEEVDSVKEECFSVCSFTSESNDDDKKPVKKGRGRPSFAKPAPTVRKSTRGTGKLVTVESEMEMSIISEDSSNGNSVKNNSRKRTRAVKSNQSISPTRSTRSRRSRGCSPSFSKEEMLLSPAQRQSMASKQPRVMFTTFKDTKDEKIVKDAGGKIAETASECTVLVTNAVKRTCKLLACVGKGIPIVSPDWLTATKRAQNFVDPWEFIILDAESEKNFGFSLKTSLKAAAKRKLFSGYSIYVTDSVKPPPADMREIIECAGGENLDTPPKISTAKVIVVSCDEDKKMWNSFKKLDVTVVNKEFILTGLLKQKMMINEYKIVL